MWRAIMAVIVSITLGCPAAASLQNPDRHAIAVRPHDAPRPQDSHPLQLLDHNNIVTVTITVHAAPTVPLVVVDRALVEASAIWRPAGVIFEWQKEDSGPTAFTPPQATRPRVIIDESRGTWRDSGAPLGWVNFAGDEPDGDIHISHGNAEQFILAFAGVAGVTRRMSPAERFLLLGRTLGRALAHEIGHYLLRSRGHATSGLMKGRRTVKEFIDPNRHGFDIDGSDQEAAARRIREITEA